MPKEQKVYKKVMTRPLSLLDCQCWDIGERIELPKQFKDLLYFDPLFIFTPGKSVSIYYNFSDPKQYLQPLINYLEKNFFWLKKKKISFDKDCQKLRKLLKNKSNNFELIADLNHRIWPMITVAQALGSTEIYSVSDKLKKIFLQIRIKSDDVLHPSLTYLNQIAPHPKTPQKNWAYHHGKIITHPKKYLKEHDIKLVQDSKKSSRSLIGQPACLGQAQGQVKIIFNLSDLKKVKKGDILITPMTVPEMIPVLQKVSAIVTDEGGITCHAAIVAREINKPCLIGTKFATQVFKDGDLVEVNNGIIKIL